jgi:hypothetical protein
MPEPFIEDVYEFLVTGQLAFNNAINELRELERNGDKYSNSAKVALLNSIKVALAARSSLPDATDFAGNHRPV